MGEEKKLIKTIFCANDQAEMPHILSAAPNGEIVATCSNCGGFLKFPATITKEKFDELVAAHKIANEGQVTQAAIDKRLAEFADPDKE